MTPNDAQARQSALDPTGSFIVQAPAGSGKTELLMQRFLALLADPKVKEPEAVLAITFTRKAAGEMRNRILEALEAAAAGPPNPGDLPEHEQLTRRLASAVLQRDRERDWQILKNPARLEVRTVDSFCEWVVRQSPLLAGFSGAAEIEPEPAPLYEEAARRTLLMLGDANEQLANAISRLLTHLDNDLPKAQELLVGMLATREQWLRHLPALRANLEAALADAVRHELRNLHDAVEAAVPTLLRTQLFDCMRYAARHLNDDHPVHLLADVTAFPAAEPQDLPKWRALAKFFFNSDDVLRGSLNKNNGFPAGEHDARDAREACLGIFAVLRAQPQFTGPVADLFMRLRELPPVNYSDAEWEFVKALFSMLPCAAVELKRVFGEAGRVDFSEIAQAAVQALATDLSLSLGARIRHVLVDEFQDTSVLQIELLRALMAAWEPGAGNTIFVVGDPMQSIYGFRDAEVALFQRARIQGIGGLKLDAKALRVNFRSQKGLVDWFNRSFRHILTEDNDLTGAVAYAESDAVRPAAGGAVAIHAFLDRDYQAEARRVAEVVETALADDDRSTVAILVRARSHLQEIVKALRARNIRFRAVKIDPLAKRQAVLDVDALTRALLYPADRTAWLTVLRAPWCGLELGDLWTLCRNDRSTPIRNLLQQRQHLLTEDARRRMERLLPVLADALACRGRAPLRQWVESVWISLGGPAAVRAHADGDVDLRDAAAYFDLLQQAEDAGELPAPAQFERELRELYSPADTAEGIRVEIMTVHTAKGLEFDTVIVPGLGRTTPPDEKRLLYWRERVLDGNVQLLLAPIETIAAGQGKDASIENYLRRIERERSQEEDKRLLYVAATRARRKLHLLGQVAAPGAQPASRSLLHLLWRVPGMAVQFSGCPTPTLSSAMGEDGDLCSEPAQEGWRPIPTLSAAKCKGGDLRRLPAGWQLPPAPPPLVWTRALSEQTTEAKPHTFEWVGETLRRVGIVTHGWLQEIGREGLEAGRWEASAVDARLPAIRAALISAGVPPAGLPAAAAKVVAALKGALGDERGRWILSAHPEAHCEFQISGVVEGVVRRVRIDRTFVDAGVRWLIDYKVADLEGGSRERFLDTQAEKYRPDLELYRKLATAFDSRPVRCALYFPLLGAFRELFMDGAD